MMTKNAKLAKFFDDNYNMAKLVKKMIGLIVSMAEEEKLDAATLDYEVFMPRGAHVLVVRIKKKGE